MFWKEANVVATFVMIHVGMYTKVYVFWKVFNAFESGFESVLWCVVLKNRQVFLQVDKYLRAIYPKVLKDICYVFKPF